MYLSELSKTMAEQPDATRLTESLVRPCRLTVMIFGSLLFGFFAVGRQFISTFYGAAKVEAWNYTLIILVPVFINMTDAVVISVLDVANKRLARSLVLLGATVANIILTILLMRIWGIYGAVIATAFSLVLEIIIMNLYYQRVLKIQVLYLFREAYRGLLPFQFIAGTAVFFLAKLITSPLLSLLIGGVLYLVLSLGMIGLFGLNEQETNRIKGMIGKFTSRKKNSV